MAAPTTSRIKVLIVDDHALMRAGMRMLIECHAGLLVVGEAATQADALDLAAREHPDIILLDLDLGDANSLDVLPDLIAAAAGARVIIVTGVRDFDQHQRAVSLGAMGLVRKEQAADVLVQAIERVYAGEIWLEPAVVARVLSGRSRARSVGVPPNDPATSNIGRLTAREREVVALIVEGLYNKQIAQRLSISETTVSHHLTSIFAKLSLANRFDLVIYAHRHGLVAPSR